MSELLVRLNKVQGKEERIFSVASNIVRIHNDFLSIRNQLSSEVTQRSNILGQIQRINRSIKTLEGDMNKAGNFLGESIYSYIKAEEKLLLETEQLITGYSKSDTKGYTLIDDRQVYVNKKKSGFLDWIGSGIQSGIGHIGDFFNKAGEVVSNTYKQAEEFLNDATEFLNSKIETFVVYSTEIYLKARDAWVSWKDDVSDFFQENWGNLKEWASGVEWGEVGIGTLQMIGGVLETAAGLTIATATSVTGIGLAGGLYMSVDGVSNVSGGFTRIFNGFKGNKDGDTGNFMKAGYKQLSSLLGFKSEYGEVFYNGTQLVIGLISLGSGLKDLPKASVNIYKNFLGGVKVTQGAKTFSYFAREGSTLGKFVFTNSGMLVKSTRIYLDKLALGLSLIGVDMFNISTLFDQEPDEKDDEIIIDERNIIYE